MGGWARDFVLLLPNLLAAVVVIVVTWIAARLMRNLVTRLIRRVSHSEQVNWLLAQMVYVGVFAAGVFIALGILGLQKTVASLMAGAGSITLALGFAFQDIGANLMAGIYLSVRRPFRRGQLIKTQDFFGTVHEVNLRWTEVYTPQGQLVLIPNKQVFENPVMNYSSLGRRRIDLWRSGRLRRFHSACPTGRSSSTMRRSARARSTSWSASGSPSASRATTWERAARPSCGSSRRSTPRASPCRSPRGRWTSRSRAARRSRRRCRRCGSRPHGTFRPPSTYSRSEASHEPVH